ncbi:hypothetical protein ACH5RR_008451 [Cinchona calisaya]|uniref:Homologous recombination OB-fold protein OB-fold domain-containing protein n=1 Tax=Cinchona calisaya TaxID=153742 RepID=A0ABD3AD70_9GENT
MEPWEEALDLDDSDIPSLLRPCKRLHHQSSIPAATSASTSNTSLSHPILKSCSSHISETLIIQEEPVQPQQQEEEHSCPNSKRRRIIPGPAGAVQSAMVQKSLDREKEHLFSSQTENVNPISTQDYIRRAIENAPEFDDDFSSHPWLSALQFIGTADGVVPSVPLNSINQCANHGKVDQVVAIIKSCTHSIGGLMVTLKDPTGTIGASVHQKVLSESQFAKDFSIGSVLVLQKVAIFSPSKTLHYLNIMPRNLVKVFNKDSGSLTKQSSLAYSVKYVAPGDECFGKAGSPQKRITPENGTSEETIDELPNNIHRRGSLDVIVRIGSGNLLPQSLTCSGSSGLEGNRVDKEPSSLRQDAAEIFYDEAVSEKTRYAEQGFSLDSDRRWKVDNIKEIPLGDGAAKSMMANHVVQGIQEGKSVQKQRQQLVSAALPQWTDEQLVELFACDDDDDGSFF